MAGTAEQYCAEALAIIERLAGRFSRNVVDVIGKQQLLDDLFLLTGTRSWPKIFFRGEFVGGLEALKARLPTLQ